MSDNRTGNPSEEHVEASAESQDLEHGQQVEEPLDDAEALGRDIEDPPA